MYQTLIVTLTCALIPNKPPDLYSISRLGYRRGTPERWSFLWKVIPGEELTEGLDLLVAPF
jgi:hypothetical protein